MCQRHERRQFTAIGCMDMAALAMVVSQARGIKFYDATAYHCQHFSCSLELRLQLHLPDVVRILKAGGLGSVKHLQLLKKRTS